MNKRINVHLICIIAFLQGLVFYGPVATLYRQSRGLSVYDIFLIESTFMVLMLVFEIPWGWFADKYGYKSTLIISNLLLFISKIVFYEANSFSLFLMEGILVALASSGISGCDIALLYSSIDEEKSERAFGIYTAMSSAGFLLASLFSTIMVTKSMDFTVLSTIIPYGIAAILTFFIKAINHDLKKKSSIINSFKDVLNSNHIIIIVISIALVSEVAHSIGVFLNQIQYLRSGVSLHYFGFLTTLMQIICLLSAKACKFTVKFGQKKTAKILLTNIFVSCIILAYTINPIISVFAIAVIQGSFAITRPIILDIENKSISSENRATVLSIYAMIGDIISSMVNLSIGRFADLSLKTAFHACSIISAIACVLIWIYFNKYNYKKLTI